jgi:hypothetical protein
MDRSKMTTTSFSTGSGQDHGVPEIALELLRLLAQDAPAAQLDAAARCSAWTSPT